MKTKFQFLLVRLKVFLLQTLQQNKQISIPTGTIKRNSDDAAAWIIRISIPTGTIKSIITDIYAL